jgi:hypothetical protein
VLDPGGDDRLWDFVVAKRLDENLPAPRELSAENAVWAVSLVEGPSFVSDRTAEVFRGMLVLELLDSVTVGALKKEANHHVLETAVDEVVHDGAKLGLASQLFEKSHVRGTWCMRGSGSRG